MDADQRARSAKCLSMSISRLTALVGPARVKDLIFTARLVGAEEAAALGSSTKSSTICRRCKSAPIDFAILITGHAQAPR